MMDIFLSGYDRKDRNNEASFSEDCGASLSRETVFKKKLNSESAVQNIYILVSQILMLMEKRNHNVYFA
jgi:hypothetical protein